MKRTLISTSILAALALAGCDYVPSESSDKKQQAQQEAILLEGTNAIGMPNIVNFTQRRQLKDILEMVDQAGLVTYTYTFSEMTGKMVFFCNSMGFVIPYATQFTNPEKIAQSNGYGVATLPQADPDGNFRPSSAEGSWAMCVNPRKMVAEPVYAEPKLTTSPFPLTADTPEGTAVRIVIPQGVIVSPTPPAPPSVAPPIPAVPPT